MDNSFFAYLQQLEMLIFFSGYPLIYLIIHSVASMPAVKMNFKKRILAVLPYTYAFAGILFLGFKLKNSYPDFRMEHILQQIQNPFLFCWGVLSLIFWIPRLNKIHLLSFLHSLIFFFLVIKDFFIQKTASFNDNTLLRNNMKIYTISLLLYLVILIVFYFLSFLQKPGPGRISS